MKMFELYRNRFKNKSAIKGKMKKCCCKCKTEREITEFGKLTNSPDGFRHDCNLCRKAYREINRNQINDKLKKYYFDNKEKLLIQNKKYREENITKINEQRKEYRNRPEIKEHVKLKNSQYLPIKKEKIKLKRRTDKNFQISEILRSKIHKILKNKSTSYQNILGCDMEFFKKWIEFRFDENMNWDNLGSYWQIDHILPINKFDFKDEKNINICFHWTNLQPLTSSENRTKTDKIQLHFFMNNIVNINRFNHKYKYFLGYQTLVETLKWLRIELRYGKNAPYVETLVS